MDMEQITKITLAWELFNSGIPRTCIAQTLKIHRETIGIWISEIQIYGLHKFIDRYLFAKKNPRPYRQTHASIKNLIWNLREREKDCCGQKIQYFLNLEHNISISVPKIYEILAEKYVIKSKWKKNLKRGDIPIPLKPREYIQMDTVDFGEIYAFTAIDVFSREIDVLLRPALTSTDGLIFLNFAMKRRFNGFADTIQTDGGSEFKDAFSSNVLTYSNKHRISSPYRKNEQSFIESFNRTLRRECLGWIKYKTSELEDMTREVEVFIDRYHYHRPHIGLGMKPPLG
jgi:transposase InsO family protein